MRGIAISRVLLVVLLSVQIAPTFACGESIFRLGKGVRYRAYSAPIPGTVLVYARTAEERSVAEQLRQAGHEVLLAESEGDFAARLRQQDVDVVVAPTDAGPLIQSPGDGAISGIEWVPVYASGAGSSGISHGTFGRGVRSDDDVRKYLKAIHQRIKEQKR